MAEVKNPPTKKRSKKPRRDKIEDIIYYLNVPYHICCHLMGENHTVGHRVGAGLVVMAIGVVIAHSTAGCIVIIQLAGDIFGYFLHGIGTIPLAEAAIPGLLKKVDEKRKRELEEKEEEEEIAE